jgi:Protein of unknown function (DUF3522)
MIELQWCASMIYRLPQPHLSGSAPEPVMWQTPVLTSVWHGRLYLHLCDTDDCTYSYVTRTPVLTPFWPLSQIPMGWRRLQRAQRIVCLLRLPGTVPTDKKVESWILRLIVYSSCSDLFLQIFVLGFLRFFPSYWDCTNLLCFDFVFEFLNSSIIYGYWFSLLSYLKVIILVSSNSAMVPAVLLCIRYEQYMLGALLSSASIASSFYHLCDTDVFCLGGLSFMSLQVQWSMLSLTMWWCAIADRNEMQWNVSIIQ